MLLGTKKEKQKENSVSLFFFLSQYDFNSLESTISYFGKNNSIFSQHLEIKKNK